MLKLYDFLDSGNGYKPRLLMTLLGIPFERVQLEIFEGAARTPEFLAKNADGRIPVLELEDGSFLAQSNAILWYLAEGTPFLPGGKLDRARVLQWMFFEQYSHEPFIAVARAILQHRARSAENKALAESKLPGGYQALGVMEGHLADHDYFSGGRYTIADIALYAYTHTAEEGGFDLAPYPAVGAWLDRVAAHPGHIPITLEVG